MSFGEGCEPGDCPPGHACASDGGCRLQEGSCGSDADCADGEHCITYTSGGEFLASRDDTRCERGPGEVGEPCGGSLLGYCVAGASCVYQTRIELSPDPVAADTGSNYWFEPRVAFEYSTTLVDPICVANGSLGVGEQCSDGNVCAPGLICHRGYTPKQCRPRAGLGSPCVSSGDCTAGSCVRPELEAPYELDSSRCARADPGCDIRSDASCGYFMTCAQCAIDGG